MHMALPPPSLSIYSYGIHQHNLEVVAAANVA